MSAPTSYSLQGHTLCHKQAFTAIHISGICVVRVCVSHSKGSRDNNSSCTKCLLLMFLWGKRTPAQLNNQSNIWLSQPWKWDYMHSLSASHLAASWQWYLICSFYFLLLLCWTDSGTDGLACCVTVFFPSATAKSPHVSCVLSNTVGSGIRLSVLPVLLLTGPGNCFTGSCQMKEPPSVNERSKLCQRQAVFHLPSPNYM